MLICYDSEFLEDGRTIELISIGMVAEDGREYYAVNRNMPFARISRSEWLMENVVPSLPQAPAATRRPGGVGLDLRHPDVKPRGQIAGEVRDFILAAPGPHLWADYGAYDHVVLSQLWGAMIDHPDGVPMWTHDLRQEAERLGSPALPSLPGTEHNALSDAREVAFRLNWLRQREE